MDFSEMDILPGGFPHPSALREAPHSGHYAPKDNAPAQAQKLRLLQQLRMELPPTFSRQFVASRLGGLITAKTLSNLDAKNEGPPHKISIGRKIAYERDDFLDWLEKRLQND